MKGIEDGREAGWTVLYGLSLAAFQKLAFTRKLNSLQTGTMLFSTRPNGRVASCTDRVARYFNCNSLTGKLDS